MNGDNSDAFAAEGRTGGRRARPFLHSGSLGALVVIFLALSAVQATCSGDAASLKAAPDFPFTLYQGESELGGPDLALADLRGRPVVLNFWAGLCPPCRAEMPDFQQFHDEFNDRVTLIGIDIGPQMNLGSQADAMSLLNDLGITYPAGFTNDDNVVRSYEALGIPTTVFINSNGEIFRRWGGILNREVLEDIANEMLAQEAG